MKRLTVTLILLVACEIAWALYPPSNYGQQQQSLQQNQLQQHIRQLQQQYYFLQQQQSQGQVNTKATSLGMVLPKSIIDDFEYIPTKQGYRFSFRLPDGTRLEENAFITGPNTDETVRGAVGGGGGGSVSTPKPKLKNRKLSPGSLRALSG